MNNTAKIGMLFSSGYAFTLIALILAYASYDLSKAAGELDLLHTAASFAWWYVVPTFTIWVWAMVVLFWIGRKP